MSRVYEIQMFKTKDVYGLVEKVGAYSYNETKGWKPVQKLCLWLLNRIGCHHYANEVVDVERRLIDPDKFAKQFSEAYEEVWNITDRKPRKVYIGVDDYNTIMNEDSYLGGPFQFAVSLHKDHTYFNVPVDVIPWMRGFLVL